MLLATKVHESAYLVPSVGHRTISPVGSLVPGVRIIQEPIVPPVVEPESGFAETESATTMIRGLSMKRKMGLKGRSCSWETLASEQT
jgi:hypothetical protein